MLCPEIRLPRFLSKWLQTLPISFTSFANGSIYAHILAFYHPDIVDLTTLKPGQNLDSKRNNFKIVERLFDELGMEVSREEWLLIAKGDLDKGVEVLEMVYGYVNGKVKALDILLECFGEDRVSKADLEGLDVELDKIQTKLVKAMEKDVDDLEEIFDYFIPVFVDSDIHTVTFIASVKVLQYLGKILVRSISKESKLCLVKNKHYKSFIKTCDTDVEKISYLTDILSGFGMESNGYEKIKGMITSKGYLFLLAVLLFAKRWQNDKLNGICLTECLSVLNREADDEEKSMALHILRSLSEKMDNSKLYDEVMTKAVKQICDSNLEECPTVYIKATVAFLCKLASSKYTNSIDVSIDSVISILVNSMKKCKDGQILPLVSPLLSGYPELCTGFVESLLLSCQNVQDINNLVDSDTISWELPIIPKETTDSIPNTWNGFGVIIGIQNLLHSKRLIALDTRSIRIIALALNGIPQKVVNNIYLQLYIHIFATLGIEETSQDGWDLFLLFIKSCLSGVIISSFDALLAVLAYTHTLENTKCRRRLTGRLKKLVGIDKDKVEEGDRFYILKGCDRRELQAVQNAVRELTISFKGNFDRIVNNK